MTTANPFGPMAGPASSPAPAAPSGGSAHRFRLWGKDGFTFGDILDAINPLQQLPIVGTIYRHLTGQSISPGSRIMGGALFGGPIGAAVSAFNAMVEAGTGKALGERALEAFEGVTGGAKSAPQIAAAASPVSVFPSGRPAQAEADGATAPGETAVARAQPHQRPGGWIFNAAYGVQSGGAQPTPEIAQRSVSPAIHSGPRPRPGGWMVNAAYAGADAAERAQAGAVSVSA